MTTSSPVTLIDTIYTIAFWMSGNEQTAQELVRQTYTNAECNKKPETLFAALRQRCSKLFDNAISATYAEKDQYRVITLKQHSADIKLTVLLKDVAELTHKQIAAIVEQPLETVQQWLLLGRKMLLHESQLKASA